MKRRDPHQWFKTRARDEFFVKAKKDGYRARSAYKLIEINEKHNLVKKNDKVLDLGCAPGAWLQVLSKLTDFIDGIDLLKIENFPKARFLQADIFSKEATDFYSKNYDVILSDIAPNTSGNKDSDHYDLINLAEFTLHEVVIPYLKKGGSFCIKIFDGADSNNYYKELRNYFEVVKRVKPKASHNESSEFYFLAQKFKG